MNPANAVFRMKPERAKTAELLPPYHGQHSKKPPERRLAGMTRRFVQDLLKKPATCPALRQQITTLRQLAIRRQLVHGLRQVICQALAELLRIQTKLLRQRATCSLPSTCWICSADTGRLLPLQEDTRSPSHAY
jgi:hypothetical protein